MHDNSIGFIGGGRITRIFLQALKNKHISLGRIVVFDPNEESLDKLRDRFPEIDIETRNIQVAVGCDMVILAIHPPVMMETLSKIKPSIKRDTIIVSLAPKITIGKILSVLDESPSIVRVNPSATGIMNHGINRVAFAPSMPESQKNCVMDFLHILGNVPIVEESKIEAYAMISAMESTYFWFQLQHLKKLGMKYGLDENEAEIVLKDMLDGTVDTLFFSDLSPDEVMDLVPVKPIGEYEQKIKDFYSEKLNTIYEKIRP